MRKILAVTTAAVLGTAMLASGAMARGMHGSSMGSMGSHASMGPSMHSSMGPSMHSSMGPSMHSNMGPSIRSNGPVAQGNMGNMQHFNHGNYNHGNYGNDNHGNYNHGDRGRGFAYRGYGHRGIYGGLFAFGGDAYLGGDDYYDSSYGDSCYQRRLIPTPYGLQWRNVWVCD